MIKNNHKVNFFSNSISQAIDARLEYGVETGVEISLRRLSALGTYNLPLGINSVMNVSLVFFIFTFERKLFHEID